MSQSIRRFSRTGPAVKSAALVAAAGTGLAFAPMAFADQDLSRTYDLIGFDRVTVEGVFEVDLTAGSDYSIALTGPEDEMERVTLSVEDGTLILDQTKKTGGKDSREGVRAVITLPSLAGLAIKGVAEVDARGIDADDFEAALTGVGELTLAGACGALDADVSGVGELNARGLECDKVDVLVKGIGEAGVYAAESVKARVTGMGEINVWGSPAKVDKSSGFFSSIEIK